MNNKNYEAITIMLVFLILPSISVAAGLNVVDDIQTRFQESATSLATALQSMATWLLFSLAVISYTWAGGMLILRGADIQEFFTELVGLVMTTGLWYWFIQQSPALAQNIVQGWVWMGSQASGANLDLSASEIAMRGIDLAGVIYDASDIVTIVPFMVAALAVALLYAVMAGYALVVIVEVYIVTSAGVILLGFGGLKWTMDYAQKYLIYCMAVGIKLFVMFLVLGLGNQFVNDWAAAAELTQMPAIFTLLVTLVVIALLVFIIPNTAQALISGVSIANVGGAIGATAAAAATTGGMVQQAGKTAAGGMLALKEAVALGGSQPGNTAVNAAKALASSGAAVIGNRVMGDYNASSGSLGGSMAQQMRKQHLGGSGLYGDAPPASKDKPGATHDLSRDVSKGWDTRGLAGGGGLDAGLGGNSIGGGAVGNSGYKSPAVDLTIGDGK